MTLRRNLLALLAVLLAVAAFIPAVSAQEEDLGPPKNLKVLPKEMARKDVVALMKTFNKALGVKCKFCHNPDDYASDENKHKEIARNFMKMTEEMQAKFFTYPNAPTVTHNCFVCHRGAKEPVLAPK